MINEYSGEASVADRKIKNNGVLSCLSNPFLFQDGATIFCALLILEFVFIFRFHNYKLVPPPRIELGSSGYQPDAFPLSYGGVKINFHLKGYLIWIQFVIYSGYFP